MSNEQKVFIPLEKAKGLVELNGDDTIHTFRSSGSILIGADHSAESLFATLEKYQDTIEVSGSGARSMKHGMAVHDDVGVLFIATNEELLAEFEKSLCQTN